MKATALLLASLHFASGQFLAGEGPGPLFCGACRVLVSEIEKALDATAGKKRQLTGLMGGESDYSRSEARKVDVLEDICEETRAYTLSPAYKDALAEGKADSVRADDVFARGGKSAKLELTCLRILDDHEEDIEEVLFDGDLGEVVCVGLVGACDEAARDSL